MHEYEDEHVLCAYCSDEVNVNNLQLNDANCQEMFKFCSLECQLRMNIHMNWESMQSTMCTNCNQLKHIEMGLFVDGVQYGTCSEICFMEIKQKKAIENGAIFAFILLNFYKKNNSFS